MTPIMSGGAWCPRVCILLPPHAELLGRSHRDGGPASLVVCYGGSIRRCSCELKLRARCMRREAEYEWDDGLDPETDMPSAGSARGRRCFGAARGRVWSTRSRGRDERAGDEAPGHVAYEYYVCFLRWNRNRFFHVRGGQMCRHHGHDQMQAVGRGGRLRSFLLRNIRREL